MTRYVWVAEMRCKGGRIWYPIDASRFRWKADEVTEAFKRQNPDDHARTVKYIPAKP
jgi:hypothetical protein